MEALCSLAIRWLAKACGWQRLSESLGPVTITLFTARMTIFCGLVGGLIGWAFHAVVPAAIQQFAINGALFGAALSVILVLATCVLAD